MEGHFVFRDEPDGGDLAAADEEKQHEGDHRSHLVIERGAGPVGGRRACDVVLRQAVDEATACRPLLAPLHDRPQECRNSPHTPYDGVAAIAVDLSNTLLAIIHGVLIRVVPLNAPGFAHFGHGRTRLFIWRPSGCHLQRRSGFAGVQQGRIL